MTAVHAGGASSTAHGPAAGSGPAGLVGVGVLGAGPVTQAIHLPTLARLRDVFRVVRVMDVDAAVAASVSGRVDAAWTTSADELIADEAVEVVAVCSPHPFHAQQVIAACRAGKRAVLCEKPFAVDADQARQIAEVAAETGVPIVVGAMHTVDPAWLAVQDALGGLREGAHSIRCSIVLPPNPRFEDFATEVLARPKVVRGDDRGPEGAAAAVRGGVLGLAIHDLPLVRAFCPAWDDVEVLAAEIPDPGGYLLDLRVGDRHVHALGLHSSSWDLEWFVEVVSDDAVLRIDFPPSYVHAGSAVATLRRGGRTEVFGPFAHNGYEAEWRLLAELAGGRAQPPDVAVLIDDLVFALGIADAAAEAVRSGGVA